MKLTQYQVDAFADQLFAGNPAVVCPLQEWLPDALMQQIAAENNQAETAFFVPEGDRFRIRWFTPQVEVALCGHATLASAFVLFNHMQYAFDHVIFESLSGPLQVCRLEIGDELFLQLDFPAQHPQPCSAPNGLIEALGAPIDSQQVCLFNTDYVVVMPDLETVVALAPNMSALAEVDARGIIVTARAQEYDFVCRFFGPNVGVDEDWVTGSAFTKLVPYWAETLGKPSLIGKQVSKRGGVVHCEYAQSRVKLAGQAVLFSESTIYL